MEKGNSYDKAGFTIIEVVLVLAIAGLIFLMVFIAFPALSRTQRDSKRRDDISILLKKVKDYQTNNRGALPTGLGNNIDYDPEAIDMSDAIEIRTPRDLYNIRNDYGKVKSYRNIGHGEEKDGIIYSAALK